MLLLAAAKWILAGILLLYRQSRNRGVYFLSAALLILSLFDVNHHLVFGRGSAFQLAMIYHHVSPLMMLVGPLIFLYVKSTLSDRIRLLAADVLHTLPFWLVMVDLIPYYRLSFAEKTLSAQRIMADINAVREGSHHLFLDHFSMNLLRAGLPLCYFLYCFILMSRYVRARPRHPEVPIRQSRITLRWVGLLIGCLTAISLSYILLVFEKRNVPLSADTFEYSAFFIMILVFYAVQSVSLLFFPEILYGLPRARELAPGNVGMDGSAVSNNEAGQLDSYGNDVYEPGESELAPEGERDPFKGLSDAIVEYMHGEKPYLNQDFSVTDIVIRLGAPRHHVEYCFSRLIGERFTDFKKRLRVEHAISILPVSRGLSMEGVGRESGFASKSVFYHSFREITGKTPAEYLRQMDEQATSGFDGGEMPFGRKVSEHEAWSKEG